MATIQIRRRTTVGTGPLVGNGGSVKAGEPLIDLNGGNLYIAKADKTASTTKPLTAADYIEFVSRDNLTGVINSKIEELDLGTASKYDVGTEGGNIPRLDSDGTLPNSVIPRIALTNTFVVSSEAEMLKLTTAQIGDVCIRNDLSKTFILREDPYSTLANWEELKTPTDKVTSVNGKTGAVTISLSELGGVSTTTFSQHKGDDTHINADEREKLENLYASELVISRASDWEENASSFDERTVRGGIVMRYTIADIYNMPIKQFEIGIDRSKVLTPESDIDGGTY